MISLMLKKIAKKGTFGKLPEKRPYQNNSATAQETTKLYLRNQVLIKFLLAIELFQNNSTSFFIDPCSCNFHTFFQYPWKFHVLNSPVWIFSVIAHYSCYV